MNLTKILTLKCILCAGRAAPQLVAADEGDGARLPPRGGAQWSGEPGEPGGSHPHLVQHPTSPLLTSPHLGPSYQYLYNS